MLLNPVTTLSRAVILLSGGIDSTTLLADLRQHQVETHALIFDYGQSLKKEVELSARNAERLGAIPVVVNAPMNWLAPNCSLLNDQVPIAAGRTRQQIEQQGTPTSYVPFRNGILFAYAVAYGEARGISHIMGGCNGLNSGNYWDDTIPFAYAMSAAAQAGTSPDYVPEIIFPYATLTKPQIVARGLSLGLDYASTWSCYHNNALHCGTCDSCVQRREAMQANGLNLEGSPA